MAWNLLFSSDIGLFSLATIAFILGMGVFFVRFFRRSMDEDEAKALAARNNSSAAGGKG
ncbi:MAG: DUF3149 domain-containing protein [Rhodocyclaceae bacterium]|nr:DUF3149 domain-containing protein [Rhodocyclaceae bacterium]